ncbi:MAG TPA: DUF309 domain-containing protein [Methylomirabilota bacterium]|nr:DUF309 domain-containing protein [Methylomirabilota bacterium]
MALPLPLRNRLAELILDAVHDAGAREALAAVAAVCADPRALAGREPPARFPADLFERDAGGLVLRSGFGASAREMGARAERGWRALRDRPVADGEPARDEALDAAATLFDAGLYFEVHELLEPHWFRARGPEREALQGLIQIAVGFQHLVNGNRRGALALLHEGAAKAAGGRLAGLPLAEFAESVGRGGAALAALADGDDRFDWARVPPFPRARSSRR